MGVGGVSISCALLTWHESTAVSIRCLVCGLSRCRGCHVPFVAAAAVYSFINWLSFHCRGPHLAVSTRDYVRQCCRGLRLLPVLFSVP